MKQEHESLVLMTLLPSGSTFLTEATYRECLNYASRKKVKVSAKHIVATENYNSDEPKAIKILRVTIL